MGDVPSEIVKSPTRMDKTYKVMRRPLGKIPKTEAGGSETASQAKESLAHNQHLGKSHIFDTN